MTIDDELEEDYDEGLVRIFLEEEELQCKNNNKTNILVVVGLVRSSFSS